MKNEKYTYLDLFAGAGGLGEGFKRAGFKPIGHIDNDISACDTLKTRACFHYLNENKKLNIYNKYLLSSKKDKYKLWANCPKKLIDSVINTTISTDTLPQIFKKFKGEKIDLIIGGPPCQGFSKANTYKKTNDKRNNLYLQYLAFLKYFKPKMFVFENVEGLLSINNGQYLKDIFTVIKELGYEAKISQEKTLNAKHFNVLQSRKRVILIGWKNKYDFEYPIFKTQPTKYTINDLFKDLPHLKQGEGKPNAINYSSIATNYLLNSKIRNSKNDILTQHFARKNNTTDIKIFKIAIQQMGINKRLKYNSLPINLKKHKENKGFQNKFKVINGRYISHTITAHISKDGYNFIHPIEPRCITPREAARIQTFPDNYFFEGSRSAIYKQIGNAVPVLMAEKIAEKIKDMLNNPKKHKPKQLNFNLKC